LNPEPFSPPPWAALKSNATTPMDESDSTFDPKDEEAKDNDVEDDDRKPAEKKKKKQREICSGFFKCDENFQTMKREMEAGDCK